MIIFLVIFVASNNTARYQVHGIYMCEVKLCANVLSITNLTFIIIKVNKINIGAVDRGSDFGRYKSIIQNSR